MSSLSPTEFRPGTIVTVQMKGLFKLAHHFALVTEKTGPDGLPMVVANSGESKGPAEVTWTEFVKGRVYRAFYPSDLPSETVLYNARAMSGTRYDFFHWNCEHFANACHGKPAHSHQVRGGLMLAMALGGLALVAAKV